MQDPHLASATYKKQPLTLHTELRKLFTQSVNGEATACLQHDGINAHALLSEDLSPEHRRAVTCFKHGDVQGSTGLSSVVDSKLSQSIQTLDFDCPFS